MDYQPINRKRGQHQRSDKRQSHQQESHQEQPQNRFGTVKLHLDLNTLVSRPEQQGIMQNTDFYVETEQIATRRAL
jgi:hypothetical protein